jgi:hypothetical protein
VKTEFIRVFRRRLNGLQSASNPTKNTRANKIVFKYIPLKVGCLREMPNMLRKYFLYKTAMKIALFETDAPDLDVIEEHLRSGWYIFLFTKNPDIPKHLAIRILEKCDQKIMQDISNFYCPTEVKHIMNNETVHLEKVPNVDYVRTIFDNCGLYDDLKDDTKDLDDVFYTQLKDMLNLCDSKIYKIIVEADITEFIENNLLFNRIMFFRPRNLQELFDKYAYYMTKKEEDIDNFEELFELAQNYIQKRSCVNLEHKCKTCDDAAKNGHLVCLKYLHEKGRRWDSWTCLCTARNGHLYCLKYLHDNGCPWDLWTCSYAALNGHLDCLKYAHENGCPWDHNVCSYAAENGHLDCLRYAHENGCPWESCTCLSAAINGHLDCLKYLHENGCPWDNLICPRTAFTGHLDCLKYLHENGCPWDSHTSSYAADGGHLDCLKYAHENGCPWDHNVCSYAALNGHLDCLKYARENGCPWDHNVCSYAALNGHLDCLKYAHENGCPWDELTCSDAASGGYLDCLKYAHENGCPWDSDTCSSAARNRHLACLEYAHENGCPS